MEALKDEAEPGEAQARELAVAQSVSSRVPRTSTLPAEGVSIPPRSWSRVDLPLPEGPTIAT